MLRWRNHLSRIWVCGSWSSASLMLMALAMQIDTMEVNQRNPPLRFHLRITIKPLSITQPPTNEDCKIWDVQEISLKQRGRRSAPLQCLQGLQLALNRSASSVHSFTFAFLPSREGRACAIYTVHAHARDLQKRWNSNAASTFSIPDRFLLCCCHKSFCIPAS